MYSSEDLERFYFQYQTDALPHGESLQSFHYGSDAGAEMAAIYHSVIGTVKLHGSSVWNFIGTFF